MQKLVWSIGAAPWIRHCYISEMVEDRWVHAAMHLTSIEFSFDPCNIYRDCPRGVPRGNQNVVTKSSRVLLKTSHSKPIYRYISVAEPELYNGGRTVEGRGPGIFTRKWCVFWCILR